MARFVEKIESTISVMRLVAGSPTINAAIEQTVEKCIATLSDDGKIILAGNGGSAADSQHIAAEFVSRYRINREPLAAIALTTDTSALTAIGNDYGYENVFSRQLAALGRPKDIFIGITTSGRSPNVIAAFKEAKNQGIFSIALTGEAGLADSNLADCTIGIPSSDTGEIQELHIQIAHYICEAVEEAMVSRSI